MTLHRMVGRISYKVPLGEPMPRIVIRDVIVDARPEDARKMDAFFYALTKSMRFMKNTLLSTTALAFVAAHASPQEAQAFNPLPQWDGSFKIIQKPRKTLSVPRGLIIIDDVVTEVGDDVWKVLLSASMRTRLT